MCAAFVVGKTYNPARVGGIVLTSIVGVGLAWRLVSSALSHLCSRKAKEVQSPRYSWRVQRASGRVIVQAGTSGEETRILKIYKLWPDFVESEFLLFFSRKNDWRAR
jgi:hypothetical protein